MEDRDGRGGCQRGGYADVQGAAAMRIMRRELGQRILHLYQKTEHEFAVRKRFVGQEGACIINVGVLGGGGTKDRTTAETAR